MIGRGNYHWQHETCLYAVRSKGKGKAKLNWQGGAQSTIWTVSHTRSVFGHGTQKPVELFGVRSSTTPGPARWSSSRSSAQELTIIAAQTCARRCVGVELNPRYADVIVNRYQSFTGKPALLALTAKTFADVTEERLAATPASAG